MSLVLVCAVSLPGISQAALARALGIIILSLIGLKSILFTPIFFKSF